MTENLISIIIPTYNKASVVLKTLDSIKTQTYANWECILVDDGSTEASFSVIKKYVKNDKRFSIHHRPLQLPKGANACRNYGFSLSKGNYIQFFDSDDIMLPTCLEGRLKQIEGFGYDFVVFSMGLINGSQKSKDKDDVQVIDWESAINQFLRCEKLPWNLQRMFIKRNALKGEILFNEQLKRFQDIEFNIRFLMMQKPQFKIIPEIDCYYRIASGDNPRSEQFHSNVFESLPVFFSSIYNTIPESLFENYRANFKVWLYNLTGLYTVKSIPFKNYKNIVKTLRQYLKLSYKQVVLLYLLFLGKKHFKDVRGSSYCFKCLKALY